MKQRMENKAIHELSFNNFKKLMDGVAQDEYDI